MLRAAVCVSGGGTNLQAIIDAVSAGTITNTEIALVISNKPGAYALERAKKAGISSEVLVPKDYENRNAFGEALIQSLNDKQIDLVVLAGYLVILPENFVKAFEGRIINIHPSLIPSHCGAGYYGLKVHESVLARGNKVTGATVHFVDEGQQKKVLVICNTVTKAQKLYRDIIESGMCCDLLHSRYINRHRRILENKIMDFSKDESAIGIWITTQIVEASLDIDFDVLFTEMATADSLLQRMGRCNRAGYISTDQPNVYVYVNNSGVKNDKKRGIYDRVIYDRSVETLRRYDGKLMSETDKRNYINEVYDINAIEGSWYFDTIKKNLDKFENLKPLDYKSKKDVDYDFREINSITLIPDDEYYNNCDIIEKEIALLQTPRVDREIRQLIRSDILDRTLSLNLYSSKYGVEGIDTCIEGTNIHRTSMRYEFDEETGTGVGLDLFNKNDEDNFL